MVAVVVGAGDSALTKAVKAGDLQAVRALVKQGAVVNVRSGDGSTPLLWAARWRSVRDRAACSSRRKPK
jgi:ankyrin repeat protein